MIEPTEQVIRVAPFVVRRRARWAECDPAGVVYTGRFVDYLLSAVSLFHESLVDGTSATFKQRYEVQTPCKALSMVFDGALWPDDVFDMQVGVTAIRTASYDVGVRAVRADGGAVFSGTVSPICIARDERRAVPIPAALRERLQASLDAAT